MAKILFIFKLPITVLTILMITLFNHSQLLRNIVRETSLEQLPPLAFQEAKMLRHFYFNRKCIPQD